MIKSVVDIAKQAGQEILKLYESSKVEVLQKKDDSPITKADIRSHRVVVEGLTRLFPDIPVLSEESPEEVFAKRRSWEKFWLVDPLDGTKDFIAKTGQFTVNIALVENRVPTLGVIYIPVTGKAYWAERSQGSFRDGVRIFNKRQNQKDFIAADSHFHSSKKMQEFFRLNSIVSVKPIGSSIKFCAFAEGEIDVYPRLAPTCEWDTAAGQVIAEEAGGEVLDLSTGRALLYNKESHVNPEFLLSRKGLSWLT